MGYGLLRTSSVSLENLTRALSILSTLILSNNFVKRFRGTTTGTFPVRNFKSLKKKVTQCHIKKSIVRRRHSLLFIFFDELSCIPFFNRSFKIITLVTLRNAKFNKLRPELEGWSAGPHVFGQ